MLFHKKGSLKRSLLLEILLTLCSLSLCDLVEKSDDNYLRLTPNERTALGKFRVLMRPYLITNFMREDIYLIRWLRSVSNLDIQQAQQMFFDHLRWRRSNNIDNLMQEDFSDMHADYPYSFDAHDLYGRPIGTLELGSWNLRRAAHMGRIPRLLRYMTKLLETNTDTVFNSLHQGKNVTDFVILANLDGFNMFQHGCPLCMPVYSTFIRTLQNHYPGYTNQFILVNTPPAFRTVLDTIQPLFTPRMKRSFKVFGKNRPHWMEYLQRNISKEELQKALSVH